MREGLYSFSADDVLILYFCSSYSIVKMKALVSDWLLVKTGKLYLKTRLRKPEKIERELTIKYEGQYRNAGLMLLFDVFMALAVLAIVSFLAVVLYFTTV